MNRRKVTRWAATWGAGIAILGLGSLAVAQAPDEDLSPQPGYVPDVVLVAFHEWAKAGSFKPDSHFLVVDEDVPSPYFVRFRINSFGRNLGLSVEQVVAALKREPSVRVAEPEYYARLMQGLPNDPLFPDQWYLHHPTKPNINVVEAWQVTMGSPDVRVAVVDTGISMQHNDLKNSIAKRPDGSVIGWNIQDNSPNWDDTDGHGTRVAGLIAAEGNNQLGIIGVAPNVKLMPIKVTQKEMAAAGKVVRGLDFARENGAHVINLSANVAQSTLIGEAIARAGQSDILVVVPWSNPEPSYLVTQAWELNNVLAVMNFNDTTPNDTDTNVPSQELQRPLSGHYLVSAPSGISGGGLITTNIPNGYSTVSGFSFSAAIASGVAGLVRSKFPNLTAEQVRERIFMSSMPYVRYQYRRVNAARAVSVDNVPPATPKVFRGVYKANTALEFDLRCVGDDGNIGAATYYDIRYSYNPITEANFSSARLIRSTVVPKEAKQTTRVFVSGLLPGRTVYFGIRAFDKAGNASGLFLPQPIQLQGGVWQDNVQSDPQWTGAGSTGNVSITNGINWNPSRVWLMENTPNTYSMLTMIDEVTLNGPSVLNYDICLPSPNTFTSTGDRLPDLFLYASLNGGPWFRVLSRDPRVDQRTSYYTTWRKYCWNTTAAFIPANAGDRLRLRFAFDGLRGYGAVMLDNFSLITPKLLHHSFNGNKMQTQPGGNGVTPGFWTSSERVFIGDYAWKTTFRHPSYSTPQLWMPKAVNTSKTTRNYFGFWWNFASRIFPLTTRVFNDVNNDEVMMLTGPSGSSAYPWAPNMKVLDSGDSAALRLSLSNGGLDVFIDGFFIVGEPKVKVK